MSDEHDDDPMARPTVSDADARSRPRVSDADARGVDAGVRALRDVPVETDRMVRMRAGLDARIAAGEGDTPVEAVDAGAPVTPTEAADAGAPVPPISAHPRWRRPVWAAAAAVAAAILIAWLLPRLQTAPLDDAPRDVAHDPAPPAPPLADHDASPSPPAPALAPPREPIQTQRVADAPSPSEPLVADVPSPSEPLVADVPSPSDPGELETASDEELAVALEYEELADYDVIAQLELLELLDALETNGRI